MGAISYFGKPVNSMGSDSTGKPDAKRYVDLFTWSDGIHLRIEPVGAIASGQGPAVTLSPAEAKELREALDSALFYLGHEEQGPEQT
jgi:hypothetical protein